MDRDRFSHISTPLLDGLGSFTSHLRRYFLTGLILIVPMAVTIVVVFWLFDFTDSLLGDRVATIVLDVDRVLAGGTGESDDHPLRCRQGHLVEHLDPAR